MDNIPSKEERVSQSNIVGELMYGKNWSAIIDSIKDQDPVFADFIKEIPYGSVFPRDGLSLRDREITAISVLTQLNLKSQLKSHIIAGLNVGLTQVEIKEIMLQLAMYIGYPLALDGLKVAKEVFDRKNGNE